MLHEAIRYDINVAATLLGSWFDAKVQETEGTGKHRRPRWSPEALLNTIPKAADGQTVIDPRNGRTYRNGASAVSALRGMSGIGVRTR